MEYFMVVRGNLKFVCFCVNMDIIKILIFFVMIFRYGGCDQYLVWYGIFYLDVFVVEDYIIDVCVFVIGI